MRKLLIVGVVCFAVYGVAAQAPEPPIADTRLSVHTLVREDILLVLPPHPHCDWNGERECPGASASATLSDATDELPGPDVWGVLDQLKPKS